MSTHPAMLEFGKLLHEIRNELPLKEAFNIKIQKTKYYGIGADSMTFQVSISLGSEFVTGHDPIEVLYECMRRVGWTARQANLQLSAPGIFEPEHKVNADDAEFSAPVQPVPPSQAPDDDIPF